MSGDDGSLRALEALLTEFHSPLSDNFKKKEIEKTLSDFRVQPSAWEMCLFFLTHTNNHYVIMFCLHVLQTSISKASVNRENKAEIKNTIYGLLMSPMLSSLPPFLRNKMIQLIVTIAKCDWPHDYPDFFDEITMMLRNEKTLMMGLTFVKIASEELMGNREGISMERKSELNLLFNQHIPVLFELLNNILTSMMNETNNYTRKLCDNINKTTFNIPSTPNCNNCFPESCEAAISLTLDCLCDLFTWFDFNNNNVANNISILNEHKNPVNENLLQNHHLLFSNILELSTVFIFDTHMPNNNIVTSTTNKHIHVCKSRCRNSILLKALSCLCELLSRNFVASSGNITGPLVAEAIQAVLQLLWQLLFEQPKLHANDNDASNVLRLLDESYIRKLMTFLNLFISNHLRLFESHPNFQFSPFLTLLTAFTFKQPNTELYLEGLEMWRNIVDPIVNMCEQQHNKQCHELANKYKEALLAVVTGVLCKINFKTNQCELELMDDEEDLDDLKTEWASFLLSNLDLISDIAKLYPEEILEQTGLLFEEQCAIYSDLKKFIVLDQLPEQQHQQIQQQHINAAHTSSRVSTRNQHNYLKNHNHYPPQNSADFSQHGNNSPLTHPTLFISSEADARRLHCSLKDLSTCLQLYSSLIEPFLTPKPPTQTFQVVIERLVNVLKYSSQVMLYRVGSLQPDALKSDLQDVFTQSLLAVKVYSSLLNQFRGSTVTNGDNSSKLKYDWMVETILNSVIPIFLHTEHVPDKVLMAASQTLYSMLTVVRPVAIYNNNQLLQQLYRNKILLPDIPKKVEQQTYIALVYCLILPWPNTQQQDWENRGNLIEAFMGHLLQPFLCLTGVGQLQKLASDQSYRQHMQPTVMKYIELMTDIITNLDNAGGTSPSKKLCYMSLEKAINLTLRLLPIYIQSAETTCVVLSFFQALVQVHRLNMGAPLVSRIVQDVIELFSKELIMASLDEEKSSGHLLIDKFLHILLTIVSEPASIFKQFLSGIIIIALKNVYPPIANRPSPLIKSSLFNLFHDILHYNWRYFFPNSLLASQNSLSSALSQSVTSPTCLQDSDQHFLAIMQAIGESFMQSDIDLFKQNLQCLNNLNSHFQLFNKESSLKLETLSSVQFNVMPTTEADIFRKNLLKDFLRVLLNALLQKSHDLHRDDVTTTIFNMAAVDFDSFFTSFVPFYLQSLEGLDAEEKVALGAKLKNDKDSPTFSKNLETFANDYWYYRLKKQA